MANCFACAEQMHLLSCNYLSYWFGFYRPSFWKPSVDFDMGLDKTIDWYINNKEWINNVLNGNHNEEYKTNNIILNK